MSQQKNKNDLLLIIDGHSMVFRAWFAIPERLTTSTGKDTRGAYGFLATLMRTIRERKPTHLAITFDTRAPTFRDELFDEYKAHRPPVDPELHAQIPMVEDIAKAFNIPVYKLDGFEADDIVGTLCNLAEKQGFNSIILTGDADQLQLVSEQTKLLMYSGFGEVRLYDEDAVKERYDGLGPEFVAEIKALEGDPSDNIPGVPKIGKKSARTVLNKFGHFPNLFSNLDRITEIPKSELRGAKGIMDRLKEHEKTAYKGLELTKIVRDVPIEIDLSDTEFGNYSKDVVVEILEKMEFRTIIRQIPDPSRMNIYQSNPTFSGRSNLTENVAGIPLSGQEIITSSSEAVLAESKEYRVINEIKRLQQLVEELSTTNGFAFDTETTGLNPMRSRLVGVSFSNRVGSGWYVPVGHNEGKQIPLSEAVETMRPIFQNGEILKTAHNANFDMMVLRRVGIIPEGISFDSMIAAALCGHRAIGLKQLAAECLNFPMSPITDLIGKGRNQINMAEVQIDKAGNYACADADATWRLKEYFEANLDKHSVRRIIEDIEIPLLPVIVDMQLAGITIDVELLKGMSEELASELSIILESTKTVLGGRELNLNANQQIASVLIDEFGAPRTRRTKTGWSMDANALEGILQTEGLDERIYQVASSVLKYRELAKLKSTYVDALPKLIPPGSTRVHTSFNQVGSSTGRLSSTDPNVQNIPVRTELGRKVRSAFTTDYSKGWTLLAADYSQIELRVLAHLSRESTLLEAFLNGEDIHNATARAMYGVLNVNDDQRRMAKILNFGVIYGLGAQGVARQTDLSRQQGQEFINLYFGKYPGLRDYIEELKQKARDNGYAETIIGRRRYLPEITSRNGMYRSAAERIAVNMPIQGTAADIVKIAMLDVVDAIREQKFHSRMLIQVHDELIFEVAPGELLEIQALVQEIMPKAMKLEVPLTVETKAGVRWGDME